MNKPIIRCTRLKKTYHDGTTDVQVLDAVDLAIYPGDRIAILGVSGSGKSTLLHVLGGLDNPTEGNVFLHDVSWDSLSEKARCRLRNKHLGFVYQFHHLLPEFNAAENIAMPLLLAGLPTDVALAKAKALLEKVGLAKREKHKPAQLSGGERQRIAIARALVHEPLCVLADEPTGNLDKATAHMVFECMLTLNKEANTALVIVTHDKELAAQMDKIYTMQEGNLVLSEHI